MPKWNPSARPVNRIECIELLISKSRDLVVVEDAVAESASTGYWWERWPEMNLPMEPERLEDRFDDIVGDSPALKRMLRLAMKAARSDAPLLILGEPGSGKQLIARAIHRVSLRRNESFVKINCSMTDHSMLERALFGHPAQVEGANQIGRIEAADNGIVFLHEISELPLSLQDKLLRLLERGEFERGSGTPSIRVNVRLIASTKHDLGERVGEELFRENLYDKLNIFPIPVPALRERREDIPQLARYFVGKFARRMNKQIKSIAPETMSSLVNSDWPGNVQQLENLIERSVALSKGPALRIPRMELQSPTLSDELTGS